MPQKKPTFICRQNTIHPKLKLKLVRTEGRAKRRTEGERMELISDKLIDKIRRIMKKKKR